MKRPDPGPLPLRGDEFEMVAVPPGDYAGRLGDKAIVTEVTKEIVYVRFASGIRECFPIERFQTLFRGGPTPG
jgi:hypothetical protein